MKTNSFWKINCTFICLLAVFSVKVTSCPAEILALKCQCRRQLNGIQLECSDVNFFRVIQALSKAKLPLASLKIRDENLRDIPNEAFSGLLIEELDISENSLLRTIGPKAFSNLEKQLRIIRLANNSLNALPNFQGLRVLESLDLSGNQLSFIPDGAFKGATKLAQLRLNDNKICFLSSTAMTEIRDNLVQVDLSGNCLSIVPSLNLAHAKRLRHLNLSRNRIGPNLIAFSFHDLPELRELSLYQNLIKRIAPRTFFQLPNLENVNLKRNAVRSMESNRFSDLPKLEFIDISFNRLLRIASQAVYKLPNLRQLILNDNEIRAMESGAISECPRLQVISLSNNLLSNIQQQPRVFHDLPGVILFLMANNSLHTLAPGMLDEMHNLRQLSLRNNSIGRLHSTALSKLKYLTTVDLGFNKLQTLEPNSFDGQEKLFWLDLTNNQLTAVPDNIFPRKIDHILLAGNPVDCVGDNVKWFIAYIRRNNVKTKAAANTDETVCASPQRYVGVPLRRLPFEKVNQSFQRKLTDLVVPGGFKSVDGTVELSNNEVVQPSLRNHLENPPLSKLPVDLPGLTRPPIPTKLQLLSNLPGLSAADPNGESLGVESSSDGLTRTLNDFTQPLTRFAVSSFCFLDEKDEKSVDEADQIVRAFRSDPTILPETIPELPGIKLRTISGDMLRNFLLGKPIPGLVLAKEARERITRQLKRVVLEVDGALSVGRADYDYEGDGDGEKSSAKQVLIEDLPPIRRTNSGFHGKKFSLEDLNKDAVDPNKTDRNTIMFYSIIGLSVTGGLTLLFLAILCYNKRRRRPKVYEEAAFRTADNGQMMDSRSHYDDMDDFMLSNRTFGLLPPSIEVRSSPVLNYDHRYHSGQQHSAAIHDDQFLGIGAEAEGGFGGSDASLITTTTAGRDHPHGNYLLTNNNSHIQTSRIIDEDDGSNKNWMRNANLKLKYYPFRHQLQRTLAPPMSSMPHDLIESVVEIAVTANKSDHPGTPESPRMTRDTVENRSNIHSQARH